MAKKVGVNDDMVRHRFQQALPPTLAPVIATQKTLPLDDLGRLADELVPLLQQQVSCELRSSLDDSVKHVSSYKRSDKPVNFVRNSTSSSSSSLNLVPFSAGQRSKICRSHIFFGNKARTCRSWCHWPDKSKCSVVQSRSATPVNSRSNSPNRSVN